MNVRKKTPAKIRSKDHFLVNHFKSVVTSQIPKNSSSIDTPALTLKKGQTRLKILHKLIWGLFSIGDVGSVTKID